MSSGLFGSKSRANASGKATHWCAFFPDGCASGLGMVEAEPVVTMNASTGCGGTSKADVTSSRRGPGRASVVWYQRFWYGGGLVNA